MAWPGYTKRYIVQDRSSPVVQWKPRKLLRLKVMSSNPGASTQGFFLERHQLLPRALNNVDKQNSTRVDEGRKC